MSNTWQSEAEPSVHTAIDKKLSWGSVSGGLVTLVTLVGGVLGIWQWLDQTPCCDINGTWIIRNRIEKTSYSPFKNLELKYTVEFVQNGTSFTGTGEKTAEDQHELGRPARTPIEIQGTLKGHSIDASFTDHGTKGESHGEFRWKLKDGSGAGTFLSTAANASGSSSIKRP